jgi:hypothetical protein
VGLLDKSKLVQYAYDKSNRVSGDEARILGIERNSRYRQQKEPAHMVFLTILIIQTNLDISLI